MQVLLSSFIYKGTWMLNRTEMVAKLSNLIKVLDPKATLYSYAREQIKKSTTKESLDKERDLKTISMVHLLLQRELCKIAEPLFEKQPFNGSIHFGAKVDVESRTAFAKHLEKILGESCQILLKSFDAEGKETKEFQESQNSTNLHHLIPKRLLEISLSRLVAQLPNTSIKIINELNLIYQLHVFAKKYQCTFIQHFNQNEDPFTHAISFQCYGVTYSAAMDLHSKPLTPTKPTAPFQECLHFLEELTKESTFPKKFPIGYILNGELMERLINENSILLHDNQISVNVLNPIKGLTPIKNGYNPSLIHPKSSFDNPKYRKQEPFDGSKLSSCAVKWLDEVASYKLLGNIIPIACTLKRKKGCLHSVGFTRVERENGIFYRFVDAGIGEFEGNCPKKFVKFMAHYFKLLNYDTLFSDFELNIIMVQGIERILNITKESIKKEKENEAQAKPKSALTYSHHKINSSTPKNSKNPKNSYSSFITVKENAFKAVNHPK